MKGNIMKKNVFSILMVAVKYEDGGAPRSMKEMILNLKNNYGVNVTVAVCNDELIAEWCRENKIPYVVSGHDTFVCVKEKGIKQYIKRFLRIPVVYYRNKKALKIVEKNIDLKNVDIVHTNSNRDNFGAIIAKKHHIPHVWHLREYGKEDYDTRFVFPFSIPFMNNTTRRFLAISDGVKNTWINRGISKEKIIRVYNGINTSTILKKCDYKMSEEPIRIVFAGSLFRFKGQLELIKALAQLRNEIKKNLSVDFYYEGIDPIYESELKDQVAHNNLQANCNFLGAVSNVGQLLKKYDIGITCSKSEAFGRVTVEYMAAGLITIASNAGANPEIIDDKKNGFLYKYGNPESLSRILEKVYFLAEKEKADIGKAAIEKVEHSFTDIINAQNVYAIYEDLVV